MRKIATLLLTVTLLVCAIPVLTGPALSATGGPQGFQGTIQNDTGAPMAGVLVTARNTTTNYSVSALSNSLGAYSLATLSGTYNVSATFLNYGPNITYINMVILPNGSTELNYTMTEVLGSIHGFVTDGSAPVNGVNVFLANDQRNYTTTTVGPLGEYRIGKIRPGVYVATFTKNGYDKANTLPLNIVRGVTVQKNESMTSQPCTLFGKVTDNGNSQDGVTVTAKGTDKVVVGTTDANGNYSIQLTSDSYTVTFSKKGFDSKDVSLALSPFESRRLDTSIVKATSNNTATYLFGFDLPHSLMVIGMIMALATICVALFINFKVRKKPELLGKDPQEEKKED
jgi:hypothetical protein